MAALKNRVERLEKEQRFQQWFHFERFLEGLTEEQLDDIVIYCRFPEPLPEPLPPGASRLDGLDRKSLNQRFEISERQTAGLMREMRGRNEDELRFQLRHAHWPEQPCRAGECLQAQLFPNEQRPDLEQLEDS